MHRSLIYPPIFIPILSTFKVIVDICGFVGNQTGDPIIHVNASKAYEHYTQEFSLIIYQYVPNSHINASAFLFSTAVNNTSI